MATKKHTAPEAAQTTPSGGYQIPATLVTHIEAQRGDLMDALGALQCAREFAEANNLPEVGGALRLVEGAVLDIHEAFDNVTLDKVLSEAPREVRQ